MTNLYEMPVSVDSVKSKKRVAIYARVSKSIDEQDSSYELQVEELIKSVSTDSENDLVCVFADKESGTSIDRVGFQKMLELARLGGLDRIYTKSISRFGRNTADVVSTIRDMRAIGVEIVFDKEGISTNDSRCDFMLEILSAHAAEESQQISSNVRWINEKNNRAGRNKTWKCYGYKIDGDIYTVVPSEAFVIRQIFDWYLQEVPYKEMISRLHRLGIKSVTGNDYWYSSTIENIIQNEKYVGDILLQKTVESKPLGIKRQKNRNQDQYYVRDHHAPIVSRHDFDEATRLRNKRILNHSPREGQKFQPQTYYFYCPNHNKYFVYKVERAKGINKPILLSVVNNQRKMFHYSLIEEAIVESAKFILDNPTLIKSRLTSQLACELNKLEGNLSNLYGALQDQSTPSKIKTYFEIANILTKQAKVQNVGKLVYRIRLLAERIVTERKIEDIKELFTSSLIVDNTMYLILSINQLSSTAVPGEDTIVFSSRKAFTEKYKPAVFSFHIAFI